MRKNKVAFIAHPLNLSTLSVITGIPKFFIDWVGKNLVTKYLQEKKPFVFSRMNNLTSKTGDQIDFIAVACPLLPEQMATLGSEFVLNRVIESVRVAKEDGADIVVLGGFTSVVGNEGEEVAQAVDVAITSGNTYTAALAIKGILRASEIVGLDLKKARCAVIGATGDIGSACTRFFADKVGSMAIAARNETALSRFSEELSKKSGCTVNVYKKTSEAVKEADVIISATSALTTIIDSESLKPGAVVCDVAIPANIAREIARQRKDVLVFEGGLSSVPFNGKSKNKKWDILMPQNAIYGCLAEGLILGFENVKKNFSIGRGNISVENIEKISSWAAKHGFELSEFFCGEKFYSSEDIQFLRNFIGAKIDTQTNAETVQYAGKR